MPVLAAGLPVPIPAPTHLIEPDTEFPWPWTVRPWLSGQPPSGLSDSVDLAEDLAGFLRALWRIDPGGGPLAGRHSFFRGAALEVYDRQARDALTALSGELDAPAALAVWEAALAQPFSGPPVWFHGDFAPSNLLVREGRLSAVIDFGCCGVGDPACDLTVAWTLLHGPARAAFREALEADEACWARARGWAIWKAAISVPEEPGRKRSEGLERVRRLCAQGC